MLINGWARRGYTNDQIAEAIGIGRTTLYKWCKENPIIAKAMSVGKDEADIAVEEALFRRATGYEVTEEHVEYEAGVETKRYITTKTIPPDTAALCFWLKNRRPDLWRDKHDYNAVVEGAPAITIALAGNVEQYLV